ncbi:hypothetical protein FOA52_007202 [Chlamydomonas sp. UWO 241]|nr:hypothetical protein FOA52_007202 [Chlamydomonas sp. UWO 241]
MENSRPADSQKGNRALPFADMVLLVDLEGGAHGEKLATRLTLHAMTLGALVVEQLTPSVTHVVVSHAQQAIVKAVAAGQHTAKLVPVTWVYDAAKQGGRGLPTDQYPLNPGPFIPGFKEHAPEVSISGFVDSLEKLEVLYFLALAGTNAVTVVNPMQISHVVVKDAAACGSSSKMQAVHALQKRGVRIRIVESGWLSECLRTWSVAPEGQHLVADHHFANAPAPPAATPCREPLQPWPAVDGLLPGTDSNPRLVGSLGWLPPPPTNQHAPVLTTVPKAGISAHASSAAPGAFAHGMSHGVLVQDMVLLVDLEGGAHGEKLAKRLGLHAMTLGALVVEQLTPSVTHVMLNPGPFIPGFKEHAPEVSISGFVDSLEKLEVLYFLALAGTNAVTVVNPMQTSNVVVKDAAPCGSSSKMQTVHTLQKRGVRIRIVESGWLSECLCTWSVAPEGPNLVADLAGMSRAMMTAAAKGDTTDMQGLLDHLAPEPAMMMQIGSRGTALMRAAANGHVDAMRLLLDHPSADAAAIMMLANSDGVSALMQAAGRGHVDAVRLLLDHPSADPAAMMKLADSNGDAALSLAALGGHVDAMHVLLDHPSADPAAMVKMRKRNGDTALCLAAWKGHVDAMRLLLDHPSADAAAMIIHSSNAGATALSLTAMGGHVDAMRLLLEHPSAGLAAIVLAFDSANKCSALVQAAKFAALGPDLEFDCRQQQRQS